MRANKQVWRLAEYLYTSFSAEGGWVWDSSEDKFYTGQISQDYKNAFYDKAVILMKKISDNGFTGEDNHED